MTLSAPPQRAQAASGLGVGLVLGRARRRGDVARKRKALLRLRDETLGRGPACLVLDELELAGELLGAGLEGLDHRVARLKGLVPLAEERLGLGEALACLGEALARLAQTALQVMIATVLSRERRSQPRVLIEDLCQAAHGDPLSRSV